MDSASHQRQSALGNVSQGQALPSISSLTNSLAPSEQSPVHLRQQSEAREARDSGNWSVSQSKHSSTVSNAPMGLQLQTLLNPEDAPARSSVPNTPSSSRYPSGISQHSNALPSLNQGFDHRLSVDASSQMADSRRSSVDSRMNAGMTQLNITSPSSPYDSQNVSRVSLVSNLQHQRGITGEPRPNGTSPLSPLGRNGGPRNSQARRVAPVINVNPRNVSGMPDPMAAAPTKGYAWAFPGDWEPPEERRQSSSDIATTHHHSMQHRSVTSLQSTADHAAALAASSGNYSRTPELRVSHKMAERKRRSEMKGLFDELNMILPNSPGSKSSKWEILTKSIEYIKTLSRSHEATRADNARLRPDAEYARRAESENNMMRNELTAAWNALRRLDPANPHIYGNFTGELAQAHTTTPGSGNNVLPPLQPQQLSPQAQPQPQASQWGTPAPVAMQGVEYGGMRPYEHPHR